MKSKSGASFSRGSSKQDYATPADFMVAVEKRFGPIDFDLAASLENAKAPRFYTERDNSLIQGWHKSKGLLWLNPPFNDIAPWARKCAKESALGAAILFLTPASIGSEWFANFVFPYARVLALRPRISFDGKNPYPKDCILSVFHNPIPGMELWRWK